MNCSICISKLDEFVDGELPPGAADAVTEHLRVCSDCRDRLASLRRLRSLTASLPRDIVPGRDLWEGIASRIGPSPAASAMGGAGPHEPAAAPERLPTTMSRFGARWVVPLALAASAAFLAAIADRQASEHRQHSGWAVDTIAGTPRVNSAPIADAGQLRPGEWLVTDALSRARLKVGAIGEVSIEPNSRVRLARATATDHRIELARGELNAFIWAPPRLFFVDTPSATAVDLGCAYSLRVDDRGAGELAVSSGYVALEHGGRESIIPAGWMCRTRPGAGPGTPFASEAPAALREALEAFDFDPAARREALARVLANAGASDGLTLWHLLDRAPRDERGAVFDVLARHHPPPSGVTRDGIVGGNRGMRDAWAAGIGLHVPAGVRAEL